MLDRFRLAYSLQVKDGALQNKQGNPPPRFYNAVADVVRLHNIQAGVIECKGLGRHARLKFSKDFPERGRQAIRNVWTPPTTTRPGGGRASG